MPFPQRRVVIPPTAGAESLAKNTIGFTHSGKAGDEMEAIKKCSQRSSGTASTRDPFGALSPEIIMRVVEKFLMQLEEQLTEKKVEAVFHPRGLKNTWRRRLRSADGRAGRWRA